MRDKLYALDEGDQRSDNPTSRYEDESARCVIIKLVNSPIPDELAPSSAVSAAVVEKEDHLAAFLH